MFLCTGQCNSIASNNYCDIFLPPYAEEKTNQFEDDK